MAHLADDRRSMEAQVTVPGPPDAAFGTFTAGLGTWWPTAYSWGPASLDRHELEPVEGGRVTEHTTDGGQLDWGHITEWSPPARVVIDWMIAPDRTPCPDSPSRVTVAFRADGSHTRVTLVHDRFEAHGEGADGYAEAMASEQGWDLVLAAYAEALDG